MAAGLTAHRWTMGELWPSPVPLPAWMAPKRRGRPPKRYYLRPPASAPPAARGRPDHGCMGRYPARTGNLKLLT